MPTRVTTPDGKTAITFPDGTSPDDINAAMEQATSGQHQQPPAPSPSIRPLTADEEMLHTYPVGVKGQGIGENLTNMVKNLGTGINQVTYALSEPRKTLSGLVDSLNPMSSTPNPLKQVYDGLNTRPGEVLPQLIGQSAAMDAAVGGAKPVLGKGMELAGKGAKGAGRLVGEVTAKTNALDREFNTRPGAGISENHIIAATRPSLLRKVKGTIPDLKANETSILSASQAPPMDVSHSINSPFDTIRSEKANPVTGAAPPPQMKQLSLTQAILNAQTDPITGQPIPFPRRLVQTPVEAAQFKSNIGDMANYDTVDSTLANQALKGAGAGLRDQITQAVPESIPATNLLHDTLGLRDKLQTQIPGAGQAYPPGGGIISKAINAVADPLLVTGGTTAATLLDMLGSGAQKAGQWLQGGHPPAPSSTTPPSPPPGAPPSLALPPPPNAGPGMAPPQLPGRVPSPAPPGGGIPQPSQWGATVTPPPVPPSGALPAPTGEFPFNVDSAGQHPPPNVRLTEQMHNAGPTVGPNPNLGVQGPEGAGSFTITPRRLMAPSDSLMHQIAGDQPVRTTPDSLHPNLGSQEEANVGAAQQQQVADGFANQATQATLLDQISKRTRKGAK